MNKKHFLKMISDEAKSLKGQKKYVQKALQSKNLEGWERKEYEGVYEEILKRQKELKIRINNIQQMKEGRVEKVLKKLKVSPSLINNKQKLVNYLSTNPQILTQFLRLVGEGKIKPKQKISKKEWGKIKKFNKHIGQDGTHYVMQLDKRLGTILVPVIVEGKLTEISGFTPDPDVGKNYWVKPERKKKNNMVVSWKKFSSPEARKEIDGRLKKYVKDLRQVQYKLVKDWMSAAKSGTIDFFDLIRGFNTGDVRRAHPYEIDFLHKLLTRDDISNRFRSYFKGKKGKPTRKD